MSLLFPAVPPILSGILKSVLQVWDLVWWFALPVIAAIIFWEAWLIYLGFRFSKSINWKFLEIKIPKNVLKTPKAMEQIFAAAHAPYSYGIRFWDKYWKGAREYWMVFELVAKGGETHFYLRVASQHRNMMESAIYGQYPEAEISEVPDYLDELPEVLPNAEFDVSGFEEVLRHPGYLPIRTYLSFEEPVEERRIDTIGSLIEAMSKLAPDEQMWFQVLIRPTGENFKNEGEKVVNTMLGLDTNGKKPSVVPNFDLGFTLSDVVRSPFEPPRGSTPGSTEKPVKQPRFILSPGEREKADSIQLKIAKLAFETTLRFMFIERRSQTRPEAGMMNTIHGYIRQFNTQHLNQLKPDGATTTASYAVRGLFKDARVRWRKRMLYEEYRHYLVGGTSILNIEELATLYHFPITTVNSGELGKIESRRGSPPPGLPIIEE